VQVLALNQEIEKANSKRWLNPELKASCYENWTIDDFVRKFKNKALARRIHTKLRENLDADEKRRKLSQWQTSQSFLTDMTGGVEHTQIMDISEARYQPGYQPDTARPPDIARTPEAVRSPTTPPTVLHVHNRTPPQHSAANFALVTGDSIGDQTLMFRAGK
jgi:hypothetical protein